MARAHRPLTSRPNTRLQPFRFPTIKHQLRQTCLTEESIHELLGRDARREPSESDNSADDVPNQLRIPTCDLGMSFIEASREHARSFLDLLGVIEVIKEWDGNCESHRDAWM